MQELPITTPNIVKNALILLARSESSESFKISQYITRQFCGTVPNRKAENEEPVKPEGFRNLGIKSQGYFTSCPGAPICRRPEKTVRASSMPRDRPYS